MSRCFLRSDDELDLSKIKKGRDAIATVDAILAKLTAGA